MSVFTMNRYPVHMMPSNVTAVNPVETQLAASVKVENSSDNDDDPDAKAIHSGHFMLSRIHGTSLSDEDEDDEAAASHSPPQSGFNFVDASKETCRTYKFGPKSTQTLAIDASLSKLFEKLALAYSGKLTSPKWKQFRGMHLKVVDKIRLNNVIWREWVMQYIYQKRPLVCQFATPLSDDIHTKPEEQILSLKSGPHLKELGLRQENRYSCLVFPFVKLMENIEAIVLEGYYWKRRLDTITEEYKMSRKFFKRLVERRQEPEMSFLSDDHFHSELLDKVGEVHSLTAIPRHQQTSSTDLVLNTRDLQEMMELSDSLFSSLNSPFPFPNPRELSGFGYGDFIQPGLLQLQPILEDDFMELEPIPETLYTRSPASMTNTAMDSQAAGSFKSPIDVEMTQSPMAPSPMAQSPMPASPQLLASPQQMTPTPSPSPSTPGSLYQSPQPSPSSGDSQMIIDTDNIIMNHLQMLQQQNQQKLQFQQQQQKKQQQQQLKKQKLLEQQKQLQQQKLLEQQQKLEQLEQQKLLEQQQKQQQLQLQQQQERQQHQERQKQLAILQTSLMKAHQAGNTQVAAVLLDELLKVLTSGIGNSQTDPTPSAEPALVINNQTSSLDSAMADSSQRTLNNDLQTGLLNNNAQTASLTNNQQNISQDNFASSPSVFQQSIHFKANQMSHVKNSPQDILALLNKGNRNILNPQESLTQKSVKKIVLPKQVPPKKDKAGFTVPNVPPLGRGKQRILAPAPSQPQPQGSSQATSLSQQNSKSFLAQLLTTGTYPGAILKVKSEAEKASPVTSFQPILPADNSHTTSPSTTNIKSIQSAPACISVELQKVTDFPTSVLLAAASHAFSPAVSMQEMLQNASKQVTGATGTSSMSMVSSPGQSENPQSPTFSLGPVPSSPVSVTSPGSFFSEVRSPEAGLSLDDSEFKKSTHITAELKRRQNIKGGFDLLHTLIPSISQNPNAKVSKAAMLQKTAEYCKKLKSERSQMQNEADILKQEINSLNQSISVCQSQLPATGVPFNRQRADEMKEMFEEYVKQKTLTNWKFWIFSNIIRNLFDSFNNMVSTASVDELCRTVLAWLDQYCSLVALRPIASDAMRFLSTTTSILSDPSRVPEQAAQAVIKKPTTDNNSSQT